MCITSGLSRCRSATDVGHRRPSMPVKICAAGHLPDTYCCSCFTEWYLDAEDASVRWPSMIQGLIMAAPCCLHEHVPRHQTCIKGNTSIPLDLHGRQRGAVSLLLPDAHRTDTDSIDRRPAGPWPPSSACTPLSTEALMMCSRGAAVAVACSAPAVTGIQVRRVCTYV